MDLYTCVDDMSAPVSVGREYFAVMASFFIFLFQMWMYLL